MPVLKKVHLGGVDMGRERLATFVRGTRHQILYELNCWLFDFYHARQLTIKQLPPIDDWTHSPDDVNFWCLAIPELDLYIWVSSEVVEFAK